MGVEDFLNYLRNRFGLSLPKDYVVVEENKKFRIMHKDLVKEKLKKYVARGIVAGKKAGNFFKPSTDFLQLFGNLAKKNVVELNDAQALKYMKGYDIDASFNVEEGYVVVKWKNAIVGCGLYLRGKLKNQIPKNRRLNP